jgi:hypothetical protein
MRGLSGDELLRLPVRLRGILLGRPVDLILHPTEPRALGVEVRCGDETHRFLPFPVASVEPDGIEVTSPFVLLDLPVDSFYRTQTRPLSRLRGTRIRYDGATLRDVVLGRGWRIEELVLEDAQARRRRRVQLDGTLLSRDDDGGSAGRAAYRRHGRGRRSRGPRRR